MKINPKQLAPLGLYLSFLAALAAGGIYIVQRSFNTAVQISLALIPLGIVLFVFLDPQKTKEIFFGRQVKYGSNALVLSIAFVGILVVVNYLIYTNSQRWDLTEDKKHTLAPETLQALNSLQSPVTAEAFFSTQTPPDSAKDLLEKLKVNSNKKFDYKFYDPDVDIDRAQTRKVTRDGVIVLVMDNRQEQLTYASEEEVISALLRLTNPGKRSVYFLTGHGENDLTTSGDQTYSKVKTSLEAKSYTVNTLNLLTNSKIPDDALAVIVAGYRMPLSANEISLLSAFQAKGGGLVVFSEPIPYNEAVPAKDDTLGAYLLQSWGIKLGEDVVLDFNPNYNSPLIANAASYANHSITEKLSTYSTRFPTARSVTIAAKPAGVTQTELILVSENAYAETSFEELKNRASFTQGKDVPGPLPIAVVAENSANKARVVVIGDSDFAIDKNFGFFKNGDLAINSIDWAAVQDSLINLTPKATITRSLLPPQPLTYGLVLLGVIVLPLIIALLGIVTWLQRRSQG